MSSPTWTSCHQHGRSQKFRLANEQQIFHCQDYMTGISHFINELGLQCNLYIFQWSWKSFKGAPSMVFKLAQKLWKFIDILYGIHAMTEKVIWTSRKSWWTSSLLVITRAWLFGNSWQSFNQSFLLVTSIESAREFPQKRFHTYLTAFLNLPNIKKYKRKYFIFTLLLIAFSKKVKAVIFHL